jgi:hypothetical protein
VAELDEAAGSAEKKLERDARPRRGIGRIREAGNVEIAEVKNGFERAAAAAAARIARANFGGGERRRVLEKACSRDVIQGQSFVSRAAAGAAVANATAVAAEFEAR